MTLNLFQSAEHLGRISLAFSDGLALHSAGIVLELNQSFTGVSKRET